MPRGLILARDGRTRLGAQRAARARRATHVHAHAIPTGLAVRAPGRLLVHHATAASGSSGRATTSSPARRTSSRRSSPGCRARSARATTSSRTSTRTAQQAGLRGARRAQGRGRRDRAADRQGARDGVRAGVRPERRSRTSFAAINGDPNKPLLNRTTQELYPPGSTFKVVTAAAALDTGKVTPDTIIDGTSPQTISGVPLANFGGQSFGPITLTDALTNSVNTVFAQVGEEVGAQTLVEYMERFGFYEDPQLDYPDEPDDPQRRSATARAATFGRRRLRRRPRRDRPGRRRGRDPRDAAADGARGRRGGQRRQADEAAADRPDRAPRTAASRSGSSPTSRRR